MSATILQQPRFVAYDVATGDALAGGFVYTYLPDGTTPATTWQDADEATPNTNPIVLDSAGSCLIYGSGQYQLTTTDSLGNAVPAYSGLSQDLLSIVGENYLPLTGGTLSGPGNLTMNGSLVVNNTGTIQQTGTFTNTQMNETVQVLVNNANATTEFGALHEGAFATQALFAGVVVASSSAVYEVDAVYGAVSNSSTTTVGAVGVVGAGRCAAAGTRTYGGNFTVTDDGFADSQIAGLEIDVGASATSTTPYGLAVFGAFPNGAPPSAAAIIIQQLSGTPWPIGFATFPGACGTGILLSATAETGASNSQPIELIGVDNAGSNAVGGIILQSATVGGNVVISAPAQGGGITLSGELLETGAATFQKPVTITQFGNIIAAFENNGTVIGNITWNGTDTLYNATSDRALKTIAGQSDGSILNALTVHAGAYKSAPEVARSLLVADEVQKVAPWAVTGQPDAVYTADTHDLRGKVLHRKGERVYQMLDKSALIPDIIAYCQTLKAQITALAARVKELEGGAR